MVDAISVISENTCTLYIYIIYIYIYISIHTYMYRGIVGEKHLNPLMNRNQVYIFMELDISRVNRN